MLKLSKQNKQTLKLFFQGFFKFYLKNKILNFLPKKQHSDASYVLVCAVYNVEKYLKTYFKSLIKQRLSFKNNIHIICVDDGSTDLSAKLVKQYQKLYPQNITYLYKTNQGQASARNLGLKYLKENIFKINPHCKKLWVGFSDPDDFLACDYFYEIDKFLSAYKDEDLVMIACPVVFYFEKYGFYRDDHPLNFKFKEKATLLKISELNACIQLACNSILIDYSKLDVCFDENLKPYFEDAKFVNEFLLANLTHKAVFLKNAKYFYTKRKDKSSSLDQKQQADLTKILKLGNLFLLSHAKQSLGFIPVFIQNVVLYDLYWVFKAAYDKNNFILDLKQRDEILKLLDEIFSEIDTDVILDFYIPNLEPFYKIAVLNCFKKEKFFSQAKVLQIDAKKKQILISYFSAFAREDRSVRLDSKSIIPCEKIIQKEFLSRVLCYEKRLNIPLKNSKNLEIFINNQKLSLQFEDKNLEDLSRIYQSIFKLEKQRAKNSKIWLFADRALEAGDNAECLYAYVAKTYPKQKIFFILSKNSKDYKRLKKRNFKLIDPKSLKFKFLVFKADKIISSHIDKYIFNALGSATLDDKDFVFLQHGITKNDLSSWLNKRKIDLFTTASNKEYLSIVKDFTPYKFTSKEVKLTGFARYDCLYQKPSKKQILIMPTWREYLSKEVQQFSRKFNANFTQSLYFKTYQNLLNSPKLEALVKKYSYSVLFNPHPNVLAYLPFFKLKPFIKLRTEQSLSELFMESALMITDYSSVDFEMAYLQKPVLYYQFDEGEFYAKHSCARGYFDYYKDGFGVVSHTQEQLLKELENLLENCELKEPYLSNAQNVFEFKDKKNCQRIYKAILELDEKA